MTLQQFLFIGTSKTSDAHISRRVLFSNVVFITLPLVYFIFMLLDIKVYFQPFGQLNFDQFVVPIMILYCFLGLALNKWGYSFYGRLLLLILWPLLMHIIPIIILHTPADYYIAFPLGIIFHSILIQLTISSKKEAFTFYILLFISFVLLIFSRNILLQFDDSLDMSTSLLVDSVYYTLVSILYWLLFNVMIYYVINVLDGLIQNNENQKNQLVEQNEELNQMNSTIDDINKNLEQQVNDRTIELKQKNEVLTSYAFYNAHLINGPFCRIKGLMMLKELNAIEEIELKRRLSENLLELEEAIQKLQNHLNEVEETVDPIV